jgi:hypothetical protein
MLVVKFVVFCDETMFYNVVVSKVCIASKVYHEKYKLSNFLIILIYTSGFS